MDCQVPLSTLRKFQFGPDPLWSRAGDAEAPAEAQLRKLDREMDFMEYDPSHVGRDAGEFVRVQTKTRLNLLRAAKQAKGESVLDNSVLNLGNQVITTNLGYKKSKRRKNYYNRYAKAVVTTKPKFETIAQIRSEWKELAKVDFPELKKLKVEVSKEVLSEQTAEQRTFDKAFLKTRRKQFRKLRVQEQGFIPPHDVRKDEVLMELFRTEEVPEGKLGVFLSENALYTLGAVNLAKFPFVLKARREGNKLLVWYDVTPENCFMFWESYRESTSENYIESEKKLQRLSMESTQVSETFQTSTIAPPSSLFEKDASLSKEALEAKRAAAKEAEFKRTENSRVLRIWLNEEVAVYSRLGLEGRDAKNRDILVKALFDVPTLLNNKNRRGDAFLDCIQYNSFRITKWMVQASLTGGTDQTSRKFTWASSRAPSSRASFRW